MSADVLQTFSFVGFLAEASPLLYKQMTDELDDVLGAVHSIC